MPYRSRRIRSTSVAVEAITTAAPATPSRQDEAALLSVVPLDRDVCPGDHERDDRGGADDPSGTSEATTGDGQADHPDQGVR